VSDAAQDATTNAAAASIDAPQTAAAAATITTTTTTVPQSDTDEMARPSSPRAPLDSGEVGPPHPEAEPAFGFDVRVCGTGCKLSGDRSTVQFTSSHFSIALGGQSVSSGRHFFVYKILGAGGLCSVGVVDERTGISASKAAALDGKHLGSVGYAVSGSAGGDAILKGRNDKAQVWLKGVPGKLVRSFKDGDVVGLQLDLARGTLDYYINGDHVSCAAEGLPPGKYRAAVGAHSLGVPALVRLG
jgi:hypothetical protein